MERKSKDNAGGIIDDIAANRSKIATNVPGVREELISQARRLIAALETPMETILQTVWAEPTRFVAIRLALDLKIFETLAAEPESAKPVSELCVPVGADANLVARLTRHLAALDVIREVQRGSYASTTLSNALALPKYAGAIKFNFDAALPVYAKMPAYFAKNGFNNPTDTMDGPFQYAQGPGHAFEWLNERPDVIEAFHIYVYTQRTERPSWTDEGFYPVHERLIEGMVNEGDRSAFVDVGGGVGHCLEEFRVKIPEWKGRLVLQEQESIANQVKGLDGRIEVMGHNFFNPQPIKGARVYYLRNVLHDWPDDRCRDILNQLKSVMEPGYSKMLLNENVVADRGAAWQQTSLDLHMMTLVAAQERTEAQWRELIASTGLKITGIWSKGMGNESLIELVK